MRPFWEVRREREEAQKAIQAEIKKERRKAVSEVRKLIKEYEISPREIWDWLCVNGGDTFMREKILAEMKRDEN
jgi:DNA-binding ferritin-like protein (Dps family)